MCVAEDQCLAADCSGCCGLVMVLVPPFPMSHPQTAQELGVARCKAGAVDLNGRYTRRSQMSLAIPMN